ncbi:MAG: transcriptional repressor LexA [Clostridiales bacterium]|nr:transcriptional repressor LexA [Clostridiales bacterium]
MFMEKLSKKQQRVYDYIKKYMEQNSIPPTIREIGDAVGLASTSTVHAHLETLERKGYIGRKKSKNRYLEITESGFAGRSEKKVPIVETVAAGEPIFADENIEGYFPVPREYVKDDESFMLRIKGDSMVGAGIFNNDLVLVQKQNFADNSDIVIALIDDNATCKRFFKEEGGYVLMPENEKYSPIRVNDVMILGKVVGLFRLF